MTKKLSNKEYTVIETIRKQGKYRIDNCQNPTVQNLIKKGLCDFNSDYNALILTKEGQLIDL